MVVLDRSQTQNARDEEPAVSGLSLLGSLVIVARQHGVQLSVPQLIHDHLLEPGQPTVSQLLNIAEENGLRASAVRLSWHQVLRLDKALPAIVLLRNGQAAVLRGVDEGPEFPRVTLQDPNAGEDAPLTLDEERFTAAWAGDVLLFKRDHRISEEDQPFGLRLIAQQFLRDRRIARDIGISALVLSLAAVVPVLFWRVLIDVVLYNDAYDTLLVLTVTLLVVVGFETAFGYLRRYLVIYVTRQVDAKLATYMFDKVIQLPVDFFERNPVGEITRDMGELRKIREFFTGGLLGTVLDSLVLFVFLPIMFFYSPLLTFYVVGFAALIGAWIILQLPELRKKSVAVIEVEGEKGSKTLQGMRTVKALALDRRRRQEWDVKVARAAHLRFDEGRTSNMVQTVVTPLERVMTTGVFALAVYLAVATH
jgi:ATP-binding cassette, subfamily B, bacterial HlyB/CyaB